MVQFSAPSIDEKNPLYCPSISAASYLGSLQRQLCLTRTARDQSRTRWNNRLLQSFARLLEGALLTDAYDSPEKGCFNNAPSKNPIIPGLQLCTSDSLPSSDDTVQHHVSLSVPAWEHSGTGEAWDVALKSTNLRENMAGLKRKRENFSDIRGPFKYARSIQSVHDSSFDVSVKHEKLSYSTGPGTPTNLKARQPNGEKSSLDLRVRELEDQLYGPPIGTESPHRIRSLIEHLDRLLPGIRLKERLSQLPLPSHQSIIDFLGVNGYLNSRILTIFRSSEIHWITLTETLMEVDGLNLCSDTLPIFCQPNSFLFLSELSLRDIQVHDFDLTYIQRLPKLSTLLLDNTSISNEAVFLLVPLKRSLKQLSISSNPDINDDAVPALLLLSRLSFLSILDTGIYMPGLRRLAKVIYDEDRIIDIEIPTACEDYVDGMHTRYLLDPCPPLITDPDVCPQLSIAALQRNLAAHAAVNPDICAAGGKVEMAERLRIILEARQMDVLIREMVIGPGDKEDSD